ncbi:TPA: hypothetical protein MIO21_03730 [Klebsiella pneumoniae subsp. pneumoniae]|nr:hypothetical protein [Klebsiella pneumoniae subsp. pneumoniae]
MTFEGREAVSDATPLVEAAIGALQPANVTIARRKSLCNCLPVYFRKVRISRSFLPKLTR